MQMMIFKSVDDLSSQLSSSIKVTIWTRFGETYQVSSTFFRWGSLLSTNPLYDLIFTRMRSKLTRPN